jgi:sugar O-acyltransferase (sialic acid O-acetyltransferase NeuD family)
MHNIILQGAGGHARVVIDCAIAQGRTVVCLFEPNGEGELYGIPIRSAYYPQDYLDAQAVVAIGDNAVRKKVAGMTKHQFTNIIHPSAIISNFTTLGQGNVLFHRVVMQAETSIGNHVILNTGAQVDHDCKISDFVHLAPGTILCGNVEVGEGAFIGTGAMVIPGKKIGAWSIVGAGTVVINDVPDGVVVVGNPARVIKTFEI